MISMSKPPRAKAVEAVPADVSLNEMMGPEGEPEAPEEAAEYPMMAEEMQSALEELGYTVTPPGGAAEDEIPQV